LTPLASYLAKQLVTRPKDREHEWRSDYNIKLLRKSLDDIHCFEVSACLSLIDDLVNKMLEQGEQRSNELMDTYAFLPAPKTWVEWHHPIGGRAAILFDQVTGYEAAFATLFYKECGSVLGRISTRIMTFDTKGHDPVLPQWIQPFNAEHGLSSDMPGGVLFIGRLLLLLINSPKIIGRRQHMPHAGLERRLVRGLGAGKFPLHAWTEILLQVAKPPEIDDGEPHEAHLTGRRALHFCRKHIRIRYGQLEYVSAHWRGDPALGIKQSRYTVTP